MPSAPAARACSCVRGGPFALSDGMVKVTLNDTGPTGDYTAADAIEFTANGLNC